MKQTIRPTATPHPIFENILARAVICLTVIILSVGSVNAQLDPTFGTNGTTITGVSQTADGLLDAFLLPDEKILVVSSGSENGVGKLYFVKYNSNGTLDLSYGTNGIVRLSFTFINTQGYYITDVARQPDGKIIIVGKESDDGLVMRFNENGTLDTGFANNGIHRPNINQSGTDFAMSVAIRSDGKILVAGISGTNSQPALDALYLLQYTTNGVVDEGGFGTDGYILYNSISANLPASIFLQSTGKIIIAPTANSFEPGTIRRFNPDGSIDSSFTTRAVASYSLYAMTLQSDDKILIAERVVKLGSLERGGADSLISRYSENGVLDTSFGLNGQTSFDLTTYFDDTPNAIKVMPDGQIVVGVNTTVEPNRSNIRGETLALARLSANGTLNGKFLVTAADYNLAKTILLFPSDGKILTVTTVRDASIPQYLPDLLLTRAVGVPLQTYTFRGVHHDYGFEYNSFDGRSDLGVFRPSNRNWYFYNLYPGSFFGLSDDIPVGSDYIGGLTTDLAMFRPSNGTWYIARSYFNASTNYVQIQWGQNGDVPAPTDFDGDGKSDLAVFRPSNGNWYIRNGSDDSSRTVHWGLSGDKPVQGDYDGDGLGDVGVFRPSDGNWYILKSSDGQAIILHFGLDGDIPVQEDYDGDGKTDIAVFRPSDGNWYRLNSSDGSFYAFHWGLSTDIAVPGDYDGDLKTDIAVWRPSNGRWYIYESGTATLKLITWGLNSDLPIQGVF